ncbi:guanylate cyclase [Elysia marginata]|uniref:Guanylate cyclase n=1 Tax=Elysia marginata TaxID=1093978 RepID=A0AAV4GV04_9GAST|nr:guanylate cyclase [Elysia marginata]
MQSFRELEVERRKDRQAEKRTNLSDRQTYKQEAEKKKGEPEVNSFVGAFHDAVILYAIALNESLADGVAISNGSEITRRMWNRTFTGITGTVSIDKNGDRNADYSLLDMDPETSKFRVVANYFGNRKQFEPEPDVEIHWAGDRTEPPPDTPTCGFDGSKCPPDEPFPVYLIVIIVLLVLILVVLIVGFFVYSARRTKPEKFQSSYPETVNLKSGGPPETELAEA